VLNEGPFSVPFPSPNLQLSKEFVVRGISAPAETNPKAALS